MAQQNKSPAAVAAAAGREGFASTSKTPTNATRNAPTKIDRIFALLVNCGTAGLNSFEAAQHGERHLHSTVSALQRKHGLFISREFVTVAGWRGIPTRICRYWLSGADLKKAGRITERLQAR